MDHTSGGECSGLFMEIKSMIVLLTTKTEWVVC